MPFAKSQLSDRVAIITGGGGDIGSAIACRFAQEGANVVVADIRVSNAKKTADAINELGVEAIAVEADISQPEQAKSIVDLALSNFGKLTTLVNTAAASIPRGTVEKLSLEDWNKAFSVNLTAVFLMCKYSIPAIRTAGGGTIINIASQLGQIGATLRAPYSSSKAGLIQLTKCLAVDHARDHIRVNSLSPGAIDTARVLRNGITREEANRKRGPLHLLGRTGRVDEIAAGAVFLASEESSFMTGADLLLDGGYLAFKQSVDTISELK